jgi:monoamine oxidase
MINFEKLEDEKVIRDCRWLLEKFLGMRVPRPINMKRTRWLTNSNFYGTYSYLSVDADKNEILPKHLAQSLLNAADKPVILFAGEATDDEFSSNAHGAVNSGWRAAKELIDFQSKK